MILLIGAGGKPRYDFLILGYRPETGNLSFGQYAAINLPGSTNWGQTVGSFSPCHALRVLRRATTTWL
jgi:hypothetical protein